MSRWSRASLASFALALLATSGCSGSSRSSGFGDGADGGTFADGGTGGGTVGDDGGGGGTGGTTLFYAHTDTTLYKLDAQSIATPMQLVGKFDCVGGTSGNMTDLAVSKDGQLYGVSPTAVYPLSIQGSNVHCNATWPLPSTHTNFYGLTFAPEGTVDASEVLVAANDAGELYRVDANTGATTEIGTMGVDTQTGLPWSLSGDIVFMSNNGSPIGFATVRTCPKSGCSTSDTLIELDVGAMKPGSQSVLQAVRGLVKRGSWCTNSASPSTFGSMFGIAAYEDKVYGFSNKGDLIEIHNDDGSGCLVRSYGAQGVKFAGAGVTTSAPVIAPPR